MTDARALLGEDAEVFDALVEGAEQGPAAVLGDPFAGRELVLDALVDETDAARISFGPDTVAEPLTAFEGQVEADADGTPVVLEDCHHLYSRRIGGFDHLDRFLRILASADRPVVMGWNRYAWTYLSATRDLDGDVPTTVTVAGLAADVLATHILDQYDELPEFVVEDAADVEAFALHHRTIGIERLGIEIEVPIPVVRPGLLLGLRPEAEPDPADVVFERLATVSAGNVGVAAALWDTSRSGLVRPSDIVAADPATDLDREAAWCLRLVFAKEAIQREELESIVGDGADRVLGRLSRDGLVSIEDGLVTLEPAAVPAATKRIGRERIL